MSPPPSGRPDADTVRILHVLEPSDGGVAKHVRDLSRAQLAGGHRVEAIVAREGPLGDQLCELGVGVARIAFRPEMVSPKADTRASRSLVRLLARRRWDIVHTHGNKAGVLARPLAHALRMPVVHSPHSYAYLSQRQRPRPGMEARRALTLNIERALAPCSDPIVFPSDYDRDEAVREGIAAPRRMVVVHNGVELAAGARPDPGLAAFRGHGPLVGFLARLHEGKRPLDFVDAVASLLDTGVALKAVIVGTGPLEQAVRARIAAGGLEDHVALHPFEGAVEPALAAFDVYVLPSLWEGLPIGLVEAMAASLPVVATEVGGVPEALAHETTGFLVPPRDTGALASAIERLVRDPELRSRMGEAGRNRQRERFSLKAMLAGTEAAYDRARHP